MGKYDEDGDIRRKKWGKFKGEIPKEEYDKERSVG